MKCAVQNLQLSPVRYYADGQLVEGTNVTFLLHGKQMSCRWPWRESCHRAATRRILMTRDQRSKPRKPQRPNLRPVD